MTVTLFFLEKILDRRHQVVIYIQFAVSLFKLPRHCSLRGLSINGSGFVFETYMTSLRLELFFYQTGPPLLMAPMDPSAAIALAKDVFNITELIIRIARQDMPEMRELRDAIGALSFQIIRAQDSLAIVQDCLLPFMKTDGVAGRAAAQAATEMGMSERVRALHDHIASLKALFEDAQLESKEITRWDLIILHINPFAKERKVGPLDNGRRRLTELIESVNLGMKAVRESYMRLNDNVTHSPIMFSERLDSTTAQLERAFYDRPFRLEFHPTGHVAEDLFKLMTFQSAFTELQATMIRCGQRWVDCELVAPENEGVDMLERVEKSHRTLVSRLHNALEEWEANFNDLAKPAQEEAQRVKEKLVEWFVASCRRYLALTLAIGGRMSEGKSSLLNAIIGQQLLPTDSESSFQFDSTPWVSC